MELFASALAQLTPAAVMQHLPLDEPGRPWVICTSGPWALTVYAASDDDADTSWAQSVEDKCALVRLDMFPIGVVVSINANGLELGRDSTWGVWLDSRDDDATYEHVLDIIKELEESASQGVEAYLGRMIQDMQHAAHVLLGLEPAYATTVNF